MAVNVPSFAAWMTLYFAESVPALYVASAIMGLSSGISEASLHSYIGEIGEPRLRGTLSSLSSSGFCAGNRLVFQGRSSNLSSFLDQSFSSGSPNIVYIEIDPNSEA